MWLYEWFFRYLTMVFQVTTSSETTYSVECVKKKHECNDSEGGRCDLYEKRILALAWWLRWNAKSIASISPEIRAGYLRSLCLECCRYTDLTPMTLGNAFLNIEVLIITALPQEFSKHVSFNSTYAQFHTKCHNVRQAYGQSVTLLKKIIFTDVSSWYSRSNTGVTDSNRSTLSEHGYFAFFVSVVLCIV
jgi:hypothetical protein